MGTYKIPEENLESLEKRFQTIEKKAAKYGCSVKMAVTGTVYETHYDNFGRESIRKYYMVEAEGLAQVNGWEFLAVIEHQSAGNIIRSYTDEPIPEKYRTCGAWCEHCHQNRARKDTYLVKNLESGEIKQVGKSCLKDYTCGLSPEMIALIESWDKELNTSENWGGGWYTEYYSPEKMLCYAAEVIRFYGYVKSDSDFGIPTKIHTRLFYEYDRGQRVAKETAYELERKIDEGFNPESQHDYVKEVIAWINEVDDSRSDYLYNLKVIVNMEYITTKHLGYLVSLIPAYEREKSRKEEREKVQKAEAVSDWQGEKGKRITIKIQSADIVTSWETQFGTTNIWKIIDDAGNVYIWKTGNHIPEKCKEIIGTVKEHDTFNNVKQTILTRCKCA